MPSQTSADAAQSAAGSAYLEAHVGPALSSGLAELVKAQPSDGVAFLSNYLSQYASSLELQAERSAELSERDSLRTVLGAAADKLRAKEDAASSEKAAAEAVIAKLLSMASSEETIAWTDSTWSELASSCKFLTGAKAAYAGAVGPSPEGETEVVFRHGDEKAVGNAVKETEGVCFKAFEEVARPEDLAEDASWRSFQEKHVPFVTDEPAVKFFRHVKLGAFAAFPLIVSASVKSEAALDYFVDFETKALEEKPEPEEGAEPVPEPVAEPPTHEAKYSYSKDES